jgi:hypothetical protein
MRVFARPGSYVRSMGRILLFGVGILVGMVLLPILILQAIF